MKYFTAYIRNVHLQRTSATVNINKFYPKIKALTFFFAAFPQFGLSCKQTCISSHQRSVQVRAIIIVTETQLTHEAKLL